MATKYPAKEWTRAEVRLGLHNKTVDQACQVIRDAAEGLEGAKIQFSSGGYYRSNQLNVVGYRRKTAEEIAEEEAAKQRRKEAQAKRRAQQRERDKKAREQRAIREAQQAANAVSDIDNLVSLMKAAGYKIEKVK